MPKPEDKDKREHKDEKKRYKVSVHLHITEITEDEKHNVPYFTSSLCYEKGDYGVVVAVQQVLVKAQKELSDMGIILAETKGFQVPGRV